MTKNFMHIIAFVGIFLTANMAFAQNVPIDFEAGGFGADWTWTVFENDTNPPLEIVANPDASGANTSATVAKFTALQSGQPWAGCESQHGADIETFTLDETNCTVKIMVHKPVISDVGIKFARANGEALPEIKVPNTLINQWEELTFDFSSRIGHPATIDQDQIIIFPDFDLAGRTSDNVVYFDNITFSEQIGSTDEPTVAAPTPTHNPADVISIFSDAYSNVAGTDFYANWGQATVVSEVEIEGNNTLLYSGLNYQGIVLADDNHQDVTGMTHLHLDFWTANSTALNIFLISPGPVETPFALTVPTAGWASVNIPLTAFAPVDLADVFQFKFDGNGDIYLDNLYFYAGSITPTEPTEAAPTPTVDAADVISIFSDAYPNVAGTDFYANWGQATVVSEVEIEGNNTLLYSGLNYQGIALADDNHQDVTGMTHLHLDFWTVNSTALNIFLISPGPVETPFALSVPTAGWASVNIPLTAFAPVDLADVFQFKFDGNGDIYLDNLYFYDDESIGVEDGQNSLARPGLQQNYPNPFNPATTINFTLAAANHVSLNIYDISGRLVKSLVNENLAPDTYQVAWNGTDDNHTAVASGIYFYRLVVDGQAIDSRRMTLIK